MAKLAWDQAGEKQYHLGVSKGVLYPQAKARTYPKGVAWNGLSGVTASPDGAEPNDLYADNIKYASIRSAENFGMTIKAYMYPEEWGPCDGSAEIAPGVRAGQQARTPFGFSWQSMIGNDTANEDDDGYIIHMVWGATAKPSEQDYETVNENPDAMEFSWECDTVPEVVDGYKPIAHMEINSLKADPTKLKQLEDMLYGTESAEPKLPTPKEVIDMFKAN